MAKDPSKICNAPMCATLIPEDGPARCPSCTTERRRVYDRQRGSASSRGYDRHWRVAREAFLAEWPVCEITFPYPIGCVTKGLKTEAKVVDHKVPHNGDRELFWDRSNWQRGCVSCHGLKTALEDGRWAPRAQVALVVPPPLGEGA